MDTPIDTVDRAGNAADSEQRRRLFPPRNPTNTSEVKFNHNFDIVRNGGDGTVDPGVSGRAMLGVPAVPSHDLS